MVTAMVSLSEAEQEMLRITAENAGKSQEELLREGMKWVLAHYGDGDWRAALKRGRGLWKDRDDLPSSVGITRGIQPLLGFSEGTDVRAVHN